MIDFMRGIPLSALEAREVTKEAIEKLRLVRKKTYLKCILKEAKEGKTELRICGSCYIRSELYPNTRPDDVSCRIEGVELDLEELGYKIQTSLEESEKSMTYSWVCTISWREL